MGDVIALATHPAREHRVTVRLSAEEAQRLNAYSTRYGIAASNVVRLSIARLLEAEERRPPAVHVDDLETALRNVLAMPTTLDEPREA